MARFIVTHNMAQDGTQEEFIERAKQVVALRQPGTEWLNSWWVEDAGRLFCEWEAPDADAVWASLEAAKDLFPIEAVHEVQWIDPQWYK